MEARLHFQTRGCLVTSYMGQAHSSVLGQLPRTNHQVIPQEPFCSTRTTLTDQEIGLCLVPPSQPPNLLGQQFNDRLRSALNGRGQGLLWTLRYTSQKQACHWVASSPDTGQVPLKSG
mmetsp:Transcript_137786/g.239620  ORF Transcript_137786/g.239620 Transcript_137786/m.239620 type:complete len:118 (-) Transcript_137786:68-421(-)